MKKSLGRYVIVDAEICHGQPTFDGTRIFVSDVLADVARGMDWDAIIKRWHGAITKDAIAEAVELAGEALASRSDALVREPAVQ
ncbi:MAG TPA: DUF433 domain-containing protein [Pirellulales bacterium]